MRQLFLTALMIPGPECVAGSPCFTGRRPAAADVRITPMIDWYPAKR